MTTPDETVEQQAARAHELQLGWTTHADELAIRDLFLGLHGPDLLRFKALLNGRDDVNDIEKLLFADIGDDTIRRQILDHIAAEANSIPTADAKIISDIDDTVVSVLHDDRFPRGMVYPGVEAFLTALDGGHAADSGSPGDLTFITARPSDPSGWVEGYTRRSLAELDLPPHAVLTGGIFHLASKELIKEGKIGNFTRYREIFPECPFVFIGDSGQADIEVGLGMIALGPDHIRAVLIHDVVGKSPVERAALASEGVWLFDTYAGAAVHAHGVGLIGEGARDRVIAAVRAGLTDERFDPEQRSRLERLVAVETAHLG